MSSLLPNAYAIASASVIPSLLLRVQSLSLLQQHGLLGDLIRIGAVGVVFATLM